MKNFFEILLAIISVLASLTGYVLIPFLLYGLYHKIIPEIYVVYPPFLGFSSTYLLGMIYLFYEDNIKDFFNRFRK